MNIQKIILSSVLIICAHIGYGKSANLPVNQLGFMDNVPDDAFAQAKASNHILMIDFSALWCPPCQELETKVFATKKFKTQSKKIVKLKMNVDEAQSFNLRLKYRVNEFPTVLFVTSDGIELDRFVGFQTLTRVLKALNQATQKTVADETRLAHAAAAGDVKARDTLGRRAYFRADYEEAMTDLKNTQNEKELFLRSEIGSAEDALENTRTTAEEKTKLQVQEKNDYANLVKNFPTGPESVEDRLALADLVSSTEKDGGGEAKRLRTEALQMAETFKKENKVITQNENVYELSNFLTLIARAQRGLGLEADAQKSFTAAADAVRAVMKSDNEGGLALTLLSILREAKSYEAALAMCERMEAKFPKEFTFYFAEGRIRLAQEDFPAAEIAGRRALDRANGLNRVRSTWVLAKALVGQNRKREAVQVIDDTLFKTPIPKETYLQPTYYLSQLEAIRTETFGHP